MSDLVICSIFLLFSVENVSYQQVIKVGSICFSIVVFPNRCGRMCLINVINITNAVAGMRKLLRWVEDLGGILSVLEWGSWVLLLQFIVHGMRDSRFWRLLQNLSAGNF